MNSVESAAPNGAALRFLEGIEGERTSDIDGLRSELDELEVLRTSAGGAVGGKPRPVAKDALD